MKDVEVDFFTVEWKDDDIILLCSDGLSNYTNKKSCLIFGGAADA